MPSRKSSKSASSKFTDPVEITASSKQIKNSILVIITLVAILYQGIILNYVMNLEDKLCNCIRDWRHDFVKYFSSTMIGWALLILFLGLTGFKNEMLKQLVKVLSIVLSLCSLINIWCLYTYVGDLNSTNCACAVDKQKISNDFLYVWRYFLVAGVIFCLISVILSALH